MIILEIEKNKKGETMFVEKENYYFIEEFEKLGIKAVYTKKNAGICRILSS